MLLCHLESSFLLTYYGLKNYSSTYLTFLFLSNNSTKKQYHVPMILEFLQYFYRL